MRGNESQVGRARLATLAALAALGVATGWVLVRELARNASEPATVASGLPGDPDGEAASDRNGLLRESRQRPVEALPVPPGIGAAAGAVVRPASAALSDGSTTACEVSVAADGLSVEATVVDGNAAPIAGATVRPAGGASSLLAVTDAAGRFRLQGAPRGPLWLNAGLRVEAAGYAPIVARIVESPGREVLTLGGGPALRVRVLSVRGEPVELILSGENPLPARPERGIPVVEGEQMLHLPPTTGTLWLTARSTAGSSGPVACELSADMSPVTLTLRAFPVLRVELAAEALAARRALGRHPRLALSLCAEPPPDSVDSVVDPLIAEFVPDGAATGAEFGSTAGRAAGGAAAAEAYIAVLPDRRSPQAAEATALLPGEAYMVVVEDEVERVVIHPAWLADARQPTTLHAELPAPALTARNKNGVNAWTVRVSLVDEQGMAVGAARLLAAGFRCVQPKLRFENGAGRSASFGIDEDGHVDALLDLAPPVRAHFEAGGIHVELDGVSPGDSPQLSVPMQALELGAGTLVFRSSVPLDDAVLQLVVAAAGGVATLRPTEPVRLQAGPVAWLLAIPGHRSEQGRVEIVAGQESVVEVAPLASADLLVSVDAGVPVVRLEADVMSLPRSFDAGTRRASGQGDRVIVSRVPSGELGVEVRATLASGERLTGHATVHVADGELGRCVVPLGAPANLPAPDTAPR